MTRLSILCAGVIASAFTIASEAVAKDFNLIYVGGECSTQWVTHVSSPFTAWPGTAGNNNGFFAVIDQNTVGHPLDTLVSQYDSNWRGVQRDAQIDNRGDIWSSVGQLATYLDQNCNNANVPGSVYTAYRTVNTTCKTTKCLPKIGCACISFNTTQQAYVVDNTQSCVVFDYSGGDNVVRKTLSAFEDRWNILAVYAIAGAGGGSEIASRYKTDNTTDISMLSDSPRTPLDPGASCEFQNWMDVDTVRSGYGAGYWAYDDTNGRGIYHLANSTTTTVVDKWATLLQGEDDGVVAYHSSLGRADVMAFTSLTDIGPNGNYYGHYALGTLDTDGNGAYYRHWYMKALGMACLAGIGAWCDSFPCSNGGGAGGSPPPFSFGQFLDCSGQPTLGPNQHCL